MVRNKPYEEHPQEPNRDDKEAMVDIDLFVPPMLANPLEVDLPKHQRQWARVQNWIMEPKLDGIRCVLINDQDGNVKAYTRTKHDITDRLPVELVDAMAGLPRSTVLDGELGYIQASVEMNDMLWPIIDFNRTTRVTGSGAQVAQSKIAENAEHGLRLVYFTFDILRFKDVVAKGPRQVTRSALLKDVVGYDSYSMIYVVEQTKGWDPNLYESYVAAGGEGVMLKNPMAEYYPGARPTQTWYKVKKFDTVDCVIVGYKSGQGKYEGQIGALVCRTPQGVEIACSGMSDEQRFNFTTGQLVYEGKHVEIRFFGNVGKTGEGIRHPQFVRMRPDLDGDN
jgi:ATP-dependent DNA ligase